MSTGYFELLKAKRKWKKTLKNIYLNLPWSSKDHKFRDLLSSLNLYVHFELKNKHKKQIEKILNKSWEKLICLIEDP